MACIDVINHEQSTGRLREIYTGLQQSRGKLANVHTIKSMVIAYFNFVNRIVLILDVNLEDDSGMGNKY
ncbi:MAG TPA: hypothetical protein PKL31_06760 [Fulvivirga sp.]|nr:hypothetical protein [Fulvivirga sp.]